ncbi:MAG: O-sialoglycoprotein endopeptidase, partial [Firmicutes bacterium]|nr:O-sialoglycoprotein endopeptidase [Bacillota bacterium]
MALYLGIDSSNYTSSAALVSSEGEIVRDDRIMLSVEEGKRGLRQSDALFQHWKNLPGMLETILNEYRKDICAVCVSTKPRPAEGSYMPVFTAGESLGRTV